MTRTYTRKDPMKPSSRELVRIDCDMKGCRASVEANQDRAGWVRAGTPDPKYKDLVMDLCPNCAQIATSPKAGSFSIAEGKMKPVPAGKKTGKVATK